VDDVVDRGHFSEGWARDPADRTDRRTFVGRRRLLSDSSSWRRGGPRDQRRAAGWLQTSCCTPPSEFPRAGGPWPPQRGPGEVAHAGGLAGHGGVGGALEEGDREPPRPAEDHVPAQVAIPGKMGKVPGQPRGPNPRGGLAREGGPTQTLALRRLPIPSQPFQPFLRVH